MQKTLYLMIFSLNKSNPSKISDRKRVDFELEKTYQRILSKVLELFEYLIGKNIGGFWQ